jgi:hypothetical protein
MRNVDEELELLARKIMPPGGRTVSVRVDDGPPQRGILYRTDTPFPPSFREFETPEGGRFQIQVSCSDDG